MAVAKAIEIRMATIIREEAFQHYDDTVTIATRTNPETLNSAGNEWPIPLHDRPVDESFTVIGVHAL